MDNSLIMKVHIDSQMQFCSGHVSTFKNIKDTLLTKKIPVYAKFAVRVFVELLLCSRVCYVGSMC